MKNNQFDNYSPDELESQKRVISTGYFIITAASFLAMAFFVTHNMIGTSKPLWDANGLQWGVGQLAYLLISIGFAFGFNAFTYFFYQMESSTKQRAFVLFVAVAFPMFAEIGQSMTRAEETRHEAATTSETFKTMQQRVAGTSIKVDAGATTALSDAMAEKAKAETELAACTRYTSPERRARCERIETGNINAAQAKVNAAQQIGQQVLSANQGQLDKDAATLKALEHDNDFLQPIVKLLMSFGIPAIGASFVIAFIIIGSMEVAMAYLGGLLRALKDRMRELGLAVSSNKVKARYTDGVSYTRVPSSSESAPVTAFTNGANSAKQTVGEYAAKIEEGLKASPEIIATEYARAQHAREQTAAMVGDKLQQFGDKAESAINPQVGFLKLLIAENQARINNGMEANQENVRNTIAYVLMRHQQTTGNDTSHADVNKLTDLVMKHLKPSKPEIVESNGFKQSPQQSDNVNRLYQEQMREYEAGKVFKESPTPAIQRQSVADTIKMLVDAVKKSGAITEADIQAVVFDAYAKLFNPADLDDKDLLKVAAKIAKSTAPATPSPVMPFQQHTGATGLHNPVLGTAEAHFSLALDGENSRVITRVPDGGNSRVITRVLDSESTLDSDLYEELKARVITREISPTFRPVIQWLAAKAVGKNTQHRQLLAAAALDRMHRENVVELNPANDGSTIKKAKYIVV